MTRQTSNGKCNLCGGTFRKAAMTKHLKSYKQRKDTAEASSPSRSPRKSKTLHLVAEGRYSPNYWMHLEVPAAAKLAELDDFLRQIWLECCGHMSAFTVEGKNYSVAPMADFDDESMDVKLNEVIRPGMKFYHEYDFGTTTELALKVLSEGETEPGGELIRVLARNDPPPIECQSCGKPATQVCTVCIWSGEGWLCDECAGEHECGEEMLLPVVNSPRVGMCAYTG